jgi:L-lysine 6-transaminase
MVSDRIDDIEEHCFRKSSRINSTWGGNLTDMERATKYFEIIAEEKLVENSYTLGKYLLQNLDTLQTEFPGLISQARGLGLMCSFNMPDTEKRNKFLKDLLNNHLIMLGNGSRSVRFRPPLTVTKSEIDECLAIIRDVLKKF